MNETASDCLIHDRQSCSWGSLGRNLKNYPPFLQASVAADYQGISASKRAADQMSLVVWLNEI